LPESHTSTISVSSSTTSRNSTALGADSSGRGTYTVGFGRGDWAMWIIWYIAMVASLRAMGLAPNVVPVRIDEDRTPFGDL
jgi:hypothetical protein